MHGAQKGMSEERTILEILLDLGEQAKPIWKPFRIGNIPRLPSAHCLAGYLFIMKLCR